jgi:hypothetical protein
MAALLNAVLLSDRLLLAACRPTTEARRLLAIRCGPSVTVGHLELGERKAFIWNYYFL